MMVMVTVLHIHTFEVYTFFSIVVNCPLHFEHIMYILTEAVNIQLILLF